MPRTEEKPKPAARDNALVEVPRGVHEMAMYVRSCRGLTVPEVYAQYAAPGIEAEFRRCLAERGIDAKGA